MHHKYIRQISYIMCISYVQHTYIHHTNIIHHVHYTYMHRYMHCEIHNQIIPLGFAIVIHTSYKDNISCVLCISYVHHTKIMHHVLCILHVHHTYIIIACNTYIKYEDHKPSFWLCRRVKILFNFIIPF